MASSNDGRHDDWSRERTRWFHVWHSFAILFVLIRCISVLGYGTIIQKIMINKATIGTARTFRGSVASRPSHLLFSATNKMLLHLTMEAEFLMPSCGHTPQ